MLRSPVCVPLKPKRIVVLDPTFTLGMSLELGLPVVGSPLFGMSDVALQAKAVDEGVTDLGAFTQPSLEKVISLQPDLIIGSALAGEAAYEMASRIAPTVLISTEDWKSYYAAVARITGAEDRLAANFKGYEQRVEAMRSRIPNEVVSIVRITPWDFQVYLDAPNAYGPFAILRDLGVKRTAYETTDDVSLSLKRPDWETLEKLDAGTLLYIVGGANDSATSGRHEEVIANPLWQMLPAVQAGRVHRVDAGTWMEFSGVESANRVLDDVEKYIIGSQ
ncbi:iron-siderophore ABC transporter substrate-binding protein [Roseibium aggregatum]|uniref:Iron-siderophore ABC transporter substrate-binding protein n=1 Tax=Roseibium aggregatum TaxID=187304 RepID=A0A939EFI1_9HYPH|nr:iron-siderophore ABC transporter substrate-binding protein [Roseibium aggregatum]MBN9672215.1 iron-siderophore ABC transporter substrate-binding protein [Roseibium aggregatum]